MNKILPYHFSKKVVQIYLLEKGKPKKPVLFGATFTAFQKSSAKPLPNVVLAPPFSKKVDFNLKTNI